MNTTTRPVSRRDMFFLTGGLGFTSLFALKSWDWSAETSERHAPVELVDTKTPVDSVAEPAVIDWEQVRQQAFTSTDLLLDETLQVGLDQVKYSVAPVHALFRQARNGCEPLAAAALGWSSKGAFIKDRLPFTTQGRHERFLRRQIERHLFTPSQLEQAVSNSVARQIVFIQESESQLLVDLRADLADLPFADLPELASDEQLHQSFESQLKGMADAAAGSLATNVTLLVVSDIAARVTSRVLTSAVTKLAASAGMLTIGVGAAPYTMGLSLLATLLIDWLLESLWNWWADPQGELAEKLAADLTTLKKLILEGDGEPGLLAELEDLTKQRGLVRGRAIRRIIKNLEVHSEERTEE